MPASLAVGWISWRNLRQATEQVNASWATESTSRPSLANAFNEPATLGIARDSILMIEQGVLWQDE
jgi:hypothetical protein